MANKLDFGEINRRTYLGAVGAGTGLAALGMLGGSRPAAAKPAKGKHTGIPAELPSAIEIDEENLEVTLPLYEGQGPEGTVYYVLTEASDIDEAHKHGLNWAAKLKHVIDTDAVQEVAMGNSGQFNPNNPNNEFKGTVDFGPERTVVPGPDGFPPDEADPGSVGDGTYSPFITTSDEEVVYNAPHVANDSGEHDQLIEMDTDEMTATLGLVQGFYEDREIFYLSTDAYPALVAALEGGTHVPNLSTAPDPGDRDLESSAREAIFPVVNGPPGQGLQEALKGNIDSPHNITRSEQVCADPSDPTDCSLFYSPLWDLHPLWWEVDEEDRFVLEDHEEIIDLVLDGDIRSFAEDGPVNTLLGNIRALGAAVNCPVISVEEEE